MRLHVAKDYDEMSWMAANYVSERLRKKRDARLGLTTGNSPKGLYGLLAKRLREGRLDVQETRVYSVEEYLGVSPQDHRSLYSWLERMFIEPCGIAAAQVERLNGEDPEPQLACHRFDARIEEQGGLDLLIEGIGTNGHIGFNEPGSRADSQTRIVALTDETMVYNYGYWGDSVPKYGMTLGMRQILAAGEVVLLASGPNKAKALFQALCGTIGPDVPASYLRHAKKLTVFADKEAASFFTQGEGGSCACALPS